MELDNLVVVLLSQVFLAAVAAVVAFLEEVQVAEVLLVQQDVLGTTKELAAVAAVALVI